MYIRRTVVEQVRELLELEDPEGTRQAIRSFIEEGVSDSRKNGVVFGLSGGLDSCVVARLCAEALGPRKVTAFFMPDVDSSPRSREDAVLLAKELEIELVERDLTPILERFGIYGLMPGVAGKALRAMRVGPEVRTRLMKDYLRAKEKLAGRPAFLGSYAIPGNKFERQGEAYGRIKHRLRLALLYVHAELNNLCVVCAANRTEFLIGLYVRYGVDHGGDIAPIQHLYKTQVQELANVIGMPDSIRNKAPAPDALFAQIGDEDVFGMPYSTLDAILFCMEKGAPRVELNRLFGEKKVEYVSMLYKNAGKLARLPFVPQPQESELAGLSAVEMTLDTQRPA
jgi:NAD+ synthase